ncbi:MAG: inositol phosphorylceramide synthase [Candidatus Heimdallarchaeota archaeon]|nr:inositol phosphorylceramide synthase [Candidatus Heimdallarchaeota archaeon]
MELPIFLQALRLDHFLIAGIFVTALFRRAKEFIINWGPFLVLWILYDMMRGIADDHKFIHVKDVYDLELLLFGWMFDGQIPSFWMKDHISTLWLDLSTALLYTVHFAIPLTVGILIFYVSKDKEMFKYYSYTFILTTYSALVTFALLPVAPPWYVASHGFAQPEILTNVRESAAGLVNVDRFFNNFYGSFYETFNSNPYAAVPSLHSAFSFISAYFFSMKYKDKSKWVYLGYIYPLSIWFSAVYLQHHYIVDLIAGVLYVLISSQIIKRFLLWLEKRRVMKQENTEKAENEQADPAEQPPEIPDNQSQE